MDNAFDIQPLDAPLGARVTGLPLDGPLPDDRQRSLVAALYQHHLLIFPGQELTPEAYTSFAGIWGEPYLETYDNLTLPGHPAVMQVGNVGAVLSQEAFRNGASFWHTDRAYVQDCNAVTQLYCMEAPATGGETHFSNLQTAYDALDEATQEALEGLVAAHRYGGGGREDWELAVHPMSEEQAARLPPTGRHPLARHHSISRKKGLYAIAGSAFEVTRDGEPVEKDWIEDLLRRLKLHIIQEAFVYRHRYQPGDLVLWDNTATLHYAPPIGAPDSPASRRLLYRIVATGLPPVLRQGSN